MNIRERLFTGFGLYVALASIIGFFAFRDLKAVTSRLNFLEVADDVTITMLEVRRREKNYLLYKDEASLSELRRLIASLKKDFADMRSEIVSEVGVSNYELMKVTTALYEQWFEKLAYNHELQDAQVARVRAAGRDIERRLKGARLETFLVMRRHEKNMMLYKDKESYRTFQEVAGSLPAGKDAELARYVTLVTDLHGLHEQNKLIEDKMRSSAREVQDLTVKLSRKERADIALTLDESRMLLVFSLVAMLALGAVMNLKLAMSIGRPIRRLERLTKKIATGDFSESIEVEGKDEIASLAASFNQMEEKLKLAQDSLERTITMLQEKQAKLVEAEKLASVGLLCAGIAHEINNPLTSVLTFSNLMLEKMPEDDPNREKLRMVCWETERARIIVRQLLSFARETRVRLESIDINRPVTEILDSLLAQDALKGIELRVSLSNSLPEIEADPAQIGQVVLNLITNAANAITPPGVIELATRAYGDKVEITVSDTGAGIPPENLKRVFEPFFTTGLPGKGTGLGLAISYGIIKKHRGDIDVQSEPGKGSTFTVRLPIHAQV